MAKNKKTDISKTKTFREEIITQMLTLATSGFGLVAALAWNSAIQQAMKDFIEPRVPGSGILSLLIYAILITILAVTITYQLSRLSARLHLENKSRG